MSYLLALLMSLMGAPTAEPTDNDEAVEQVETSDAARRATRLGISNGF